MRPWINRITLRPGVLPALCALGYLAPKQVPVLVCSAAAHELGHLLAMGLLGIPIHKVEIGLRGAVIRATLPDGLPMGLIAVAGPAVNGLLAALSIGRWPAFCLCNLVLLGYNLLPVWPLDGGRLAQLVLSPLPGQTGEILCRALHLGTIILVAVCGLWLSCIKHMGLLPLLLAGVFLLRLPVQKPLLVPCSR